MKINGPHKTFWKWSLFLMGVLFIFMLWGCEGGAVNSYSTSDTNGETGSVAFRVNWGGDGEKLPASNSRIVMSTICGGQDDDNLIYWVTARIYDDAGAQWSPSSAWRCTDGSGTITGVPTGDKTLVVTGSNYSNQTVYCGVETINVDTGDNPPVNIDAPMFYSEMVSPYNGITNVDADGVILQWQPAPGAFGYEVWVSEYSDLSSPITYGDGDRLQGTTFRIPTGSLSPGNTYYWAVFAVDFVDGRGRIYDEIWNFSTSSGITSCDDASGTWNVSITELTDSCGSISFTPINETVTVTQPTGSCQVTIQAGTDFYTGTVAGNRISWTTEYAEDGGTTTEAFVVDFAGDDITAGASAWFWSNISESCAGTTSITGSRSSGGGGEPLPTPTNFYTESGNGEVTIYWDTPLDVSLWTLYWSTASNLSTSTYGGRIELEPTSARSEETAFYTHTGLTNGTTYYYIITSRNDQGDESVPTSPAIAGSPQISGSNDTGDSFEPNDTYGSAWDNYGNPTGWENQWLTSIAGSYPSVSGTDKRDWYKIETTGGLTRIQVDCSFIHANGDIDLYLYDASGNSVLSESIDEMDGEYIDYISYSPAVYYLQVFYFDSEGMNTYNLKWDAILP